MKIIVALQDLIKESETRIKLAKQQLSAHESGENKLTYLERMSTENTLEQAQEELAKNQEKLDQLMKEDLEKLEEQERLKEAVKRKNYYHFQKIRIKRNKVKANDVKLEAMHIIDELPTNVQFEDDFLYDIAEKLISLELRMHEELHVDFASIKEDFDKMIKDIKGESINELGLLSYQIPVIVLQFKTLIDNIKENIEEDELPPFSGLPKYEDWWISELWSSHQAYFGLYKWKSIVRGVCITDEQKKAWDSIFNSWVFIKKIINQKGALAYEYGFAFDRLIEKYCELEEEFDDVNLESMEQIIKSITQKEDFTTVKTNHNIITPYLQYKREKLNPDKDKK